MKRPPLSTIPASAWTGDDEAWIAAAIAATEAELNKANDLWRSAKRASDAAHSHMQAVEDVVYEAQKAFDAACAADAQR